MKKKIMGLMAVVVIAAVAGYNVYISQSNKKYLSSLAIIKLGYLNGEFVELFVKVAL